MYRDNCHDFPHLLSPPLISMPLHTTPATGRGISVTAASWTCAHFRLGWFRDESLGFRLWGMGIKCMGFGFGILGVGTRF